MIFESFEDEYPEWFYPKGLPVQELDGMIYRHYPAKNISLLIYEGVIYYYYQGQYRPMGWTVAQRLKFLEERREKAEIVFNGIEDEYPEWFYPKGLPVQELDGMIYRHYPAENITLLTYFGIVYYYYNGRYTRWHTVEEWLKYFGH